MILKVIKHFVQGPYNQSERSKQLLELLTTVVSSCWLPWKTQPFQNGVYSQSQESDIYLEGKQRLKMAEQFLLKVCSITFQCCDYYSQCSMDDRGHFHETNIQASFADKCSLKEA